MQEKEIKAIRREYLSIEGGGVVPTGDRTDCKKQQIIASQGLRTVSCPVHLDVQNPSVQRMQSGG